MAEESLPFNGEIVNQDGWELYHAPLQEDGLYGSPGGPVGQVYADSSGMQVKRRAGSGWVHGTWWRDTAEKLVAIGANGSSQPRIDRVVLRRDDTAKNVTTTVITGTAAATPVAPALTQSVGGTWDVPLAQVYVDPGAVSIANGKVTDERTFNGLRLWRPSALSLLPTSGVPLWQEAVLSDGSKYRWNGSAWAVLSTPPAAYSVGMSQTNGITMNAGASSATFSLTGKVCHAEGVAVTQVAHSGGGGRIIFSLPVPHAYGSSPGRVLGSYVLFTGNSLGTFSGSVVTYGGPTVGSLFAGGGWLSDGGGNFDMPAGSSLTFNLDYTVG